jgi:hypothetical protein
MVLTTQNGSKNKNEVLKLAPAEIEGLIIESLGLKVEVLKKNNKTFIALRSYQSCFRLMERLHWDFDFSVHKKDRKYIIEI